jgi:endoglycosylceramidase
MAKTELILKKLRSLGMNIVIDLHQDLYARKFTGNGFPEWSIRDHGLPFNEQHPWNLNYLQPPVIASYQSFWTNDTLQSSYFRMLKFVLTEFDSLIIGIDPMNEPFPGINIKFEQQH